MVLWKYKNWYTLSQLCKKKIDGPDKSNQYCKKERLQPTSQEYKGSQDIIMNNSMPRKWTTQKFPGGISVKDLAFSLLWLWSDPWPRNFLHTMIVSPTKKKMDNLKELDKFLETYHLPRLSQEVIENINRLIANN